jgi:hypothetical protein
MLRKSFSYRYQTSLIDEEIITDSALLVSFAEFDILGGVSVKYG